MKKKLTLICGFLCLVVLAGCKKNDDQQENDPKVTTKRAVLAYVFQDTNLYSQLTDNINDMETGWNPEIDGKLLVYVDASASMTQFGGKPVLLEIQHDKTNLIVSKIVKTYDDVSACDPQVFKKAQEDVIAMYPAESYGLIITGHGNGFFVNKPGTKLVSGSDRFGANGFDIDVLAKNMATHYEFIIFDACAMGETATLYQLRKATDFVVASVELFPGDGCAYRSDLKALFTQPKADLFTFARATAYYYQEPNMLDNNEYMTIGVYRMAKMENLAAEMQKSLTVLNMKYKTLETSLTNMMLDDSLKITNSMFYPRNKTYAESPWYYDLGLMSSLLDSIGQSKQAYNLKKAYNDVAMQKHYALTEEFRLLNEYYSDMSANLSFYIPTSTGNPRYQDEALYGRFDWSEASGFTKKWETVGSDVPYELEEGVGDEGGDDGAEE